MTALRQINIVAPMTTMVLATRNAHKVAEIRSILGDKFRLLTLNDFPGAPEIVEDANTFASNATKKAVGLAKWISTTVAETRIAPDYVLADDSGLEVDALSGAPGVHSARFAALDFGTPGNSSVPENNAKLLRLLTSVPAGNRTARFHCVIALTPIMPPATETSSPACYADEFELQTQLFDGACEGRIDFSPHGDRGFGYDPLFIPTGYAQSFAELGEDVKNQLSHRGIALQKLKAYFQSSR